MASGREILTAASADALGLMRNLLIMCLNHFDAPDDDIR